MKKTKPIASPELTKELLRDSNLVKEYVEYLRSKVRRRDDGVYYCVTKFDGPCRCWDQTERFCREKGLDLDTVFSAFSLDFGCEAKIANYFNLDAFLEEGKRQGGK